MGGFYGPEPEVASFQLTFYWLKLSLTATCNDKWGVGHWVKLYVREKMVLENRTRRPSLISYHISKEAAWADESYSWWLPKACKRFPWSSALLQIDTDSFLSPGILSDPTYTSSQYCFSLCLLKEPWGSIWTPWCFKYCIEILWIPLSPVRVWVTYSGTTGNIYSHLDQKGQPRVVHSSVSWVSSLLELTRSFSLCAQNALKSCQ